MFIELHILQNFAPSNLNRDESNNPKDCTFGGTRRARISSQCIKRATRLHPVFAQETGVETATRTKLLAKGVSEIIQKSGKTQEEADQAAQKLVGKILVKMDSKNPIRSTVLYYASQEEKERLAAIALENWEAVLKGEKELEDIIKKFKDLFKNKTSAPDIAMFGRMLAEDTALNLDAACQVAHAISTHRANMEFDYYTAVDDLQSNDETGAGMIGLTGFNAATFYRYATIDFDQLVRNLDNNIELAKKTVRAFLKASALAIPSGKQNSFAAQNPPSFLMAVVREKGATWSMANAFEKPVNAYGDKSLLSASIEALDKYWADVQEFFGEPADPFIALIGTEVGLKNLAEHRVGSLNEWLNKVLAQIDKE